MQWDEYKPHPESAWLDQLTWAASRYHSRSKNNSPDTPPKRRGTAWSLTPSAKSGSVHLAGR